MIISDSILHFKCIVDFIGCFDINVSTLVEELINYNKKLTKIISAEIFKIDKNYTNTQLEENILDVILLKKLISEEEVIFNNYIIETLEKQFESNKINIELERYLILINQIDIFYKIKINKIDLDQLDSGTLMLINEFEFRKKQWEVSKFVFFFDYICKANKNVGKENIFKLYEEFITSKYPNFSNWGFHIDSKLIFNMKYITDFPLTSSEKHLDLIDTENKKKQSCVCHVCGIPYSSQDSNSSIPLKSCCPCEKFSSNESKYSNPSKSYNPSKSSNHHGNTTGNSNPFITQPFYEDVIHKMTKENKDLSIIVKDLTKKNVLLNESVSALSKKNNELLMYLKSKSYEIKQTKISEPKIEQNISEYNDIIIKLREDNKKLEETQIANLKYTLNLEEQLKYSKQLEIDLNLRLNNVSLQNNILNEKIYGKLGYENKNSEHLLLIMTHSDKINKLDEILISKNKEISDIKLKLVILENKLLKSNSDLYVEKKIKYNKSIINKPMQKQLINAQNIILEIEKKIQSQEIKIIESSKMQNSNSQIKKLKQEIQEKNIQIKLNIDNYENELNLILLKHKNEMKEEISQYQSEIVKSNKKIKELENHQLEEISQYQSELAESNKKIKELENHQLEEIYQYQLELEKSNKKIKELENHQSEEIILYQLELAETNKKIKELEQGTKFSMNLEEINKKIEKLIDSKTKDCLTEPLVISPSRWNRNR